MVLCICPPPFGRRAGMPCGLDLIKNGLGGIITVFLCCYRDGTGHCHGVCRHRNRDTVTTQIQKVCNRVGGLRYADLPLDLVCSGWFRYMLEVYVDDFISLVIPMSQAQLRHIAYAIMEGIHNVSPPPTLIIVMIQSWKRNSSRRRDNILPPRLFWALTLTEMQK